MSEEFLVIFRSADGRSYPCNGHPARITDFWRDYLGVEGVTLRFKGDNRPMAVRTSECSIRRAIASS